VGDFPCFKNKARLMTDGKKEQVPEKPPEKIEKRHRDGRVDSSREIAKDHKIHEATDWNKPPPPPKKR
jgi:hypothetical protein